MLKTFTITMLAVFSIAIFAGAAEARGRRCNYYYAPAPVAVAPAAPAATAAVPTTGYRSFSYEPGVYVAPPMRRTYGIPAGAPNPFRDAGGKIRGE